MVTPITIDQIQKKSISDSLREQWATGKRSADLISHETRVEIGHKAWATRLKRGSAVSGAKGKHWKLTPEQRLRRALIRRGTGTTDANKALRRGIEWKLWREAVFERDNWTCQFCGVRGGVELHPHHILPFSQFSERRFDVSNGITLCVDCHRTTPTFGSGSQVRLAFTQ